MRNGQITITRRHTASHHASTGDRRLAVLISGATSTFHCYLTEHRHYLLDVTHSSIIQHVPRPAARVAVLPGATLR